MFFYLLCSLALTAYLPTIDDYEDNNDAREQRKQDHERFGAGEAQAGSSSISVFDIEAESATIGDGREEIGGADNNGAGEAQAGSSSISAIDVEEENASIGDGREEIVDANNAVSEAQSGSSSIAVIDVEEENASIGDGREEIVDANNNAVSEAQSGSSSIAVIDVEEENASAGDGREEGAHVNNNAVGEAQRGSSSRIVVDAEEKNTFIGGNREEIAGAKNKAVSEGQARSKIDRLVDVVREDGFFSVPLNSEHIALSPADAGETSFDYEQLKTAVLSENGASQPFLGQGTIVVTAEGVDGKRYRWRLAEQLGHGAYGAVYRADKVENLPTAPTRTPLSPSSSSSLDTMASVAIKFAWSERARASLVQEANRLNRMKNTPGVPQLVSVARFGDLGGVLMASEFFPRGDLEHYLKNNPTTKMSPMEMWEIAKDAFMKLDTIHKRHNIRHGDIKPSNLFLDDHNKIVFGDWGDGQTFSPLYASESFLANQVPRFRDDFVSLFLSIFQMDHTLTYDNNVLDVSTHRLNNAFWRVRDKNTGLVPPFGTELSRTASVWDNNLLLFMKAISVNNQFIEDWITLWSTIINAAGDDAGLSDEISMLFGMTCFVL